MDHYPAGRAELDLDRDPAGRTFISRQRLGYPFHLTRPFYRDRTPAGLLTIYLQSISGGLYEGERVGIEVHTAPGAEAHITSQGATVVHSMIGEQAEQTVRIEASAETLIEYLPDPLVLFPSARVRTQLTVAADASARVVLADAFLAHDPGEGGRPFSSLCSEVRIERPDGALLCLDRFTVTGEAWAAAAPGIAGRAKAQASLIVLDAGDPGALITRLRESLSAIPGLYAGASATPGGAGAWARLLAADGVALRAGLTAAWVAARTHFTGTSPALHRK